MLPPRNDAICFEEGRDTLKLDQKTKKRLRWVLIVVMAAPLFMALLAYALAILAGVISGLIVQGWGALPRVFVILLLILAFAWVLKTLFRWGKRVGGHE